jgi:hypothetical protein
VVDIVHSPKDNMSQITPAVHLKIPILRSGQQSVQLADTTLDKPIGQIKDVSFHGIDTSGLRSCALEPYRRLFGLMSFHRQRSNRSTPDR